MDEEESDRSRALVNSNVGWRTEMAKWIGAARAAEAAEHDSGDDDGDNIPAPTARIRHTLTICAFICTLQVWRYR